MAHYDLLEFNFDNVLQDPPTKKVFARYASDICHCPEIFAFLDAVEAHNQLESKKRKESAAKIVAQFLTPESTYEINISNDARAKAIKDQNFDAICESMRSELKNDIFPRFVKSDIMKRHIARLSKQSLKRIIAEKQDEPPISFSLNVMNVENNITSQDVQFLVDLSRHGTHWKLVQNGVGFAAYRTREKANINLVGRLGSKALAPQPFYKVTGTLPYNVDNVLRMLALPQYNAFYDNNLHAAAQLDYVSSFTLDQYPSSITIENYPLAWPISNRDFVLSNTVFRSTEGPTTYYMVKKSVEYERAPARKGTVRATYFSAWIIQRASELSTKYVKIFYRNMLDSDTSSKVVSFWNLINKKKVINLHNGLTSAMRKFVSANEDIKYTNGLLDTLEDFDHLLSNRPVVMRTGMDGRPDVDAEQIEILKAFWQDSENKDSQNNGGNLKRITYLSRFAQAFSNDELRDIGALSVSNNRIRNITGMLLCAEQTFYQIIEGLPEDIDRLYATIKNDPRHINIKTLKEEFGVMESERQFPIWSMRTVNLSDVDHFFAKQLKQMIQNLGNVEFDGAADETTTVAALSDMEDTPSENSDDWTEWDEESTEPIMLRPLKISTM